MVKHVAVSYVYNLSRCGKVVKPGMVEMEIEVELEMQTHSSLSLAVPYSSKLQSRLNSATVLYE